MRQQIPDHKGNSIFGTHGQVRLYKAGWKLVERKKVGCVWIIRWQDPESNGSVDLFGKFLHDVWNQGGALEILKRRQKKITEARGMMTVISEVTANLQKMDEI